MSDDSILISSSNKPNRLIKPSWQGVLTLFLTLPSSYPPPMGVEDEKSRAEVTILCVILLASCTHRRGRGQQILNLLQSVNNYYSIRKTGKSLRLWGLLDCKRTPATNCDCFREEHDSQATNEGVIL